MEEMARSYTGIFKIGDKDFQIGTVEQSCPVTHAIGTSDQNFGANQQVPHHALRYLF
jgi:hypothetical protein